MSPRTYLATAWPLLLGLALLLPATGGCASLRSRWALADPDYKAKYGGDKNPKPQRVLKRAIDARHVANKGGVYAAAGGGISPEDNALATAELGGFYYFDHWIEGHGGLLGAVHADDHDENYLLGGGNLGLRVQPPSRIAPFVGAGTFLAYSEREVSARFDGIDDDDDGFIDEPSERTVVVDSVLAGLYPEVGAHVWLTSHARLSAQARYLITTEGRSEDMWSFGLTLSFLLSPTVAELESGPLYLDSYDPVYGPPANSLLVEDDLPLPTWDEPTVIVDPPASESR